MKKINLDIHEVTEDSALCDPSRSLALHRNPQDFSTAPSTTHIESFHMSSIKQVSATS